MSSSLIAFTKDNITNVSNNVFELQFSNTSLNFKDVELAFQSISFYNSEYNITAEFNNNRFSIAMPAGSAFTSVSIVLPDGTYSYSDINKFIQKRLVETGAYLIDQNGDNVYYVSIRENATYYSCQIDCLPVPSSLPSGWSRPATGAYSTSGFGLPTSVKVPLFTIPSGEFTSIVGFPSGSYPTGVETTAQQFLSVFKPQVHPTSCYVLHCNLIDNAYTNPGDVLHVFNRQGTEVGQQINIQAGELAWLTIADGSYSNIRLYITDTSGRYVHFQDPEILITLLLRQKA